MNLSDITFNQSISRRTKNGKKDDKEAKGIKAKKAKGKGSAGSAITAVFPKADIITLGPRPYYLVDSMKLPF